MATVNMLTKLRRKFVALNMACVAVIVVVAFSAICYFDYKQDVSDVYSALATTLDVATKASNQDMHNPADQLGNLPAPFEGASDNDVSEASESGQIPAKPEQSEDGAKANESQNAGASNENKDDSEAAAPTIGGGAGQTIPVAIYTLDDDGNIADASPVGTASIDDDVLTQAAEQLQSADDGTGKLANLGLYYEKRTVNDTTYLAFADTGSAKGWQSLAITLLGVAAGVLIVFLALSMLFARWALAPVQRAWVSQRQFIADASHELKTPITVILANASIALSHPEKTVESQRSWIEGIQDEGVRMRALVDDMLTLAKHDAADALDAGIASNTQSEEVDLTALANRAALQFDAVAFERGVNLEADEGMPRATVKGSRNDLERLLGILVDNACKYAGVGGQVRISLVREGKRAALSVNNTGPVMSAEDIAHAFDRFWRADAARTADEGSFGLGLAIAKSIADAHHATLTVKSDEAHGTTFTATFPLAK